MQELEANPGFTIPALEESLEDVRSGLAEWATYFTDTGRRGQIFDRGAQRPTVREADDLIRAGETFLGLVLRCLGLPMASVLGAGLDAAVVPSMAR